jgi:transposase
MNMLGKGKARQENLFAPVRRETRISRELKALKNILDFEWFRQACKEKFCQDKGRPSIAPEVLGAMMLLGYWFNITSDRQLCEECEDRLSFREFIGISDEEEIPVHSSLTHWRQRLGKEVFQRFIAHTVELAKRRGISPGRCRLFDSTFIKAQADATGDATVRLDPVRNTSDYLDALGLWDETGRPSDDTEPGRKGGSSSGDVGREYRKRYQKRKLDSGQELRVNTHDLEARYTTKPGKKVDFYHKCHFEFDSKTGLVMDSDAGHVSDATKMVDMLSREKEPCDTVGGDTGYFTIESQLWLKATGIEPLISVRDNAANRCVAFGLDAFVYVADSDEYICPNGVKLTRQNRASAGERRYASPRCSCVGCEYASYCFQNGEPSSRRQFGLGPERAVVEEAKRRNMTHRYRRVMRKRSIICEGGIGTMKSYGGLGRARGIGADSAAIQAALAGAAYNLKKILKHVMAQEKSASEAVTAVIYGFFTISRTRFRKLAAGSLKARLIPV